MDHLEQEAELLRKKAYGAIGLTEGQQKRVRAHAHAPIASYLLAISLKLTYTSGLSSHGFLSVCALCSGV